MQIKKRKEKKGTESDRDRRRHKTEYVTRNFIFYNQRSYLRSKEREKINFKNKRSLMLGI